MDEFKTQVISFDKTKSDDNVQKPTVTEAKVEKPSIRNVLFNVTTKVPVVEESLPVTQVKVAPTQKIDARPATQINANAKALPKFYTSELRRFAILFYMWVGIVIGVFGLETWATIAIAKSGVSNWAILTMIPGAVLAIAGVIVYGSNYFNFRAEAKNADFSKEKLVTVNVTKLYRRLKTAHVNVNWFCVLTYVLAGLVILFTYIIGWGISRKWGDFTTGLFAGAYACKVTIVVSIIAMFIAFFLHIYLLVTNYTRAGKIDQFYGQQIVSNEELDLIKKKKNHRNFVIFLAAVLLVGLIGYLIYKIVMSRRVNNTVTINNN